MQCDMTNKQDKNAVGNVKDRDEACLIRRALASTKYGTRIISHFLTKTGCKIHVWSVGKPVYRGGRYGMEILCVYNTT